MSLRIERPARAPHGWPELWFEIVSTILGLVVVALVGWVGTTLVAMRDDILFLKVQLPEVNRRLDRVETRVDALDGLRERGR
jgi:hypothetical protein